jgi:putative transposase
VVGGGAAHTEPTSKAVAFNKRSLASTDYVYAWVDGIHLKVCLEQDKVCLLVMIGVRADGVKELVALDDGHRESSESWADLLRDCKRRGMRAPVLAVGDGALGFWAALAEIWNAEDKQQRRAGRQGVRRRVRGQVAQGRREDHRRPRRAPGVLRLPRRALDPPAHHQPDRVDLRHRPTRQRVTKGPGSRAAGVAMAFKLIESAQARWRAVNAPHLVALVRAGARFENGKLVERPDESGGDQQAA